MVKRSLLFAALAVAAGSCRPSSTTCGRGRCPSGACLNVITTYAAISEYELDWWCAVPCPASLGCEQSLCLQSPIKWSDTVCAGTQLEVKYRVTEGKALADGNVLRSIDVMSPHVPGGAVHCEAGKVCSAGWFSSGEYLPQITGTTTTGSTITLGSNGTPGEYLAASGTAENADKREPLGPLLPTGLDVVVTLNGTVDAHE